MSENNSALVTIGLTTYNRPDFLRESVKSVLNQKYKNFKLIIGNDYPKSKVTFETLGIDYDSRVEIINYDKNIGEINNLNYLLSKAESNWFTWLADDDLLSSYFLESLINDIDHNNSDLLAIYSEYSSGLMPEKSFFDKPNYLNSVKIPSDKFVLDYVKRNIRIIGSCGLLKTEKIKMIGGFPNLNNSSGIYCDGLIPILLAEHGSIKIIKCPLVFLRTHNESLSASSLTSDEYISAEPNFLIQLSDACLSLGDQRYNDKCIYYMVSWFTENEFITLFRVQLGSEPLTFGKKINCLLDILLYQFRVNYPRIKFIFWPLHTFHIIRIALGYFFRMFNKTT